MWEFLAGLFIGNLLSSNRSESPPVSNSKPMSPQAAALITAVVCLVPAAVLIVFGIELINGVILETFFFFGPPPTNNPSWSRIILWTKIGGALMTLLGVYILPNGIRRARRVMANFKASRE